MSNNIPSNGISESDSSDQDSIMFKFEGGVPHKKTLESEIEIFIEMNKYDYVDPDDKTLYRVMMSFMDYFVNEYTVIENVQTSDKNCLHNNGYRYNNERNRSVVSYSFSGIKPSRDEVERQVRSFIQMKNL